MINFNPDNNKVRLINYSDLKLLVNKSSNPLRELSNLENELLLDALVRDKCISSALILQGSMIAGYRIVDGFHRWALIDQVIKQEPEFNTLIPVILKSHLDESEVKLYAFKHQLARRNLSTDEITEYIDLLIDATGLKKGEALEQIAAEIGISVSTLKRKLNPSYAEKEKERQENIRNNNSFDTKKVQVGLFNSSTENINSSTELNIDTNLGGNESDTPDTPDTPPAPEEEVKQMKTKTVVLEDRSKEELQEIEDRYTTSLNERGEEVITYTSNVTSSIKERLEFNLEFVDGLRSNLDMFKESLPIYNLIADFVKAFNKLLK